MCSRLLRESGAATAEGGSCVVEVVAEWDSCVVCFRLLRCGTATVEVDSCVVHSGTSVRSRVGQL